MRSVNLDQLRALETVAELASFTAAAERLRLSQSAISVQIRELERRFGLRLVERRGRRAAATAAGRELIDHARRVAAELELAALAMQRHRDGAVGLVRVGVATTALTFFLAPILVSFGRRHPNVALTIVIDSTAGQLERMHRDEIDFGIVNLPVSDRSVDITPLRTEELVAAFPSSTAKLPSAVTPEFLARRKLLFEASRAQIKTLVLDWISPAARQLSPAMLLDNFDTILRMVAVGLGVAVAPSSVVEHHYERANLLTRPLRPKLYRTLGLIKRKNKNLDLAMRIFEDAVLSAKDDGRKRERARR